ncbi:MAG: hypothetical protein B6D64_02420 [Bacteroidetes bacterium 4484_276]|nr:MAG: hypothetical protein B6D64_02420 [Bacteroidetes bacterium 4484_276]
MDNKLTLKEVEDLVKKTYDTGYCDGVDSTNIIDNSDFREYRSSDDYWSMNIDSWLKIIHKK